MMASLVVIPIRLAQVPDIGKATNIKIIKQLSRGRDPAHKMKSFVIAIRVQIFSFIGLIS